jgi:hypothetical protein
MLQYLAKTPSRTRFYVKILSKSLSAIARPHPAPREQVSRIGSVQTVPGSGAPIVFPPVRDFYVNLFHDTQEAVLSSWEQDRKTLLQAGHDVHTLREFPTFVEDEVTMGAEGLVVVQWVQDSAFRSPLSNVCLHVRHGTGQAPSTERSPKARAGRATAHAPG